MDGDLSFDKALAAYNAGRRADAVQTCKQLLQRAPNDANAAHLLGLILLESGQIAAAYAPLRVAAGLKPLDEQLWLHTAQAASASSRAVEAVNCMRRTVLILPECGATVAQLAELHGLQGDWEVAGGLARKATVLEPVNPSHRYLHGQCRGALNDGRSAGLEMRRAALLLPGDPAILKYLANFTAWQGDSNRAELMLRRLARLTPGDIEIWRRLAAHLTARRLQNEGIAPLKRALVLDPGSHVDWKALNEIERNLQDLSSAVKVSRRYAVCNPIDADALLHLATAEHALGNEQRYRRALAAVEPLAARNPAVWQALALDSRDHGLAENAQHYLDCFFEETHRRLMSPTPDLVQDTGFISFLTSHLFAGRFEAVQDYCRAAQALPPASSRIEVERFKCASVATCASGYFREPVAWSGTGRLVVSVPVWGTRFADLWIENGLASMLTQENRRLWDRQETAFQVVTTRATWTHLQTKEAFQDLARRHHVCFIDIEPVLSAGYEATNYIAMLVAQWTSLCIAARERADCLSLVADYVFSASAFSHLADLLDRGAAEVFYTVDFPISVSAVPQIETHRMSDGTLAIPERDMVDLFLDNVSARVRHHDVSEDGDTVPTDPSRLNVRFEDGIQIRSMQPQLVYATKRALDGFWTARLGATDNGFADIVLSNLDDESRMMMLNDAECFGCAVLEVDEEARSGTGHFARRQKIREALPVELMKLIQRAGFLTRGRIWALRNPVNVLRLGDKPDMAKTAFLDEIALALPYASADAVQDIMYEMGRPALARFLEGNRVGADG